MQHHARLNKRAGAREAIEWTRNNGYLIDGHSPEDLKRLTAKLKELGL